MGAAIVRPWQMAFLAPPGVDCSSIHTRGTTVRTREYSGALIRPDNFASARGVVPDPDTKMPEVVSSTNERLDRIPLDRT